MAAAASARILAWLMPGHARGSCASSTAPTRYTSARSPGWNCGSEWDQLGAPFDCSLRSRSGWGNYFNATNNVPHPEQCHGEAGARVEGRRLLMQLQSG